MITSVELNCTSEGYPPTCVTWIHNDKEINVSNPSVTVKDNLTSSYISTATVGNVSSGNYTCYIVSKGTSIKNSSATVHIAGM